MKHCTVYKHISLITALLIFLGTVSVCIGSIHAMPLDEPLLYYNDNTWAREDRSPLKIIENEYYVPLVIFAQLDDTKVRVNNSLNTFVISHGDLYVSFDATTDIAIDQDGTYLYARTYKLDYGERYVPVVFVCENLDYGYEVFTNKYTKDTAFRITDGTEDLSFDELLELYNPDLLKNEPVSTETSSQNNTQSTSDVATSESSTIKSTSRETSQNGPVAPPQRQLGNRIIYITVDSGINVYTGGILDTLASYGYKATFFIEKSDITDYPLTLSRIITEGHKLALKPGTADVSVYSDTESFIAELDAANELLYRVYKIKTRTVRPDVLAYSNNALASDINSGVLAEHGYALWNATVKRADGLKANSTASAELIDAIWNNNSLVLDFGSNSSTSAVLSETLAFILENADKCDVRLADSSYTPPTR
ncbi:MAG: polysaccharide deacetylase family protein [Clostridia bacterium]|nr:polysaccharide deacetylase family protein [Clostridia bacterium]